MDTPDLSSCTRTVILFSSPSKDKDKSRQIRNVHATRFHDGLLRNLIDKTGAGPVTDYAATMINWLHNFRPSWETGYDGERERPHAAWITKMVPPTARVACGVDTIPNRHLHSSLNKAKHPINVVRWTPEGRRLLTGSTSGEFTLWNGMGFNFETIMQAHDSAIRAAEWSSSGDWLVSADHDGVIKYWQSNFNNVQSIQGHDQPIRDMSFSPNDAKFITASDDGTLKLFDFAGGIEEATFTGHGWDAKTVDWHPTKGLIVSGSKDHLVKLWDPRERRCLNTFHGHKNTITKVQFERTRGFCFASAARDQVARVFDLRLMRDIALLKGHEKDISTLTWHPIHPMLLTTGGHDGSIFHYLLDEQNAPDNQPTLSVWDHPEPETAPAQSIWPNHKVPFAHEMAVWTLDWHPVGHILASGSNDRITRFWTRARPGDDSWEKDRFHLGGDAADARDRCGAFDRARARAEEEQQQMEDEADALVDQNKQNAVPGLTALPPGLNLPGLATLDGTSHPSMPLLFNPPIPGPSQTPTPLGIPGMIPPPVPQAQGGSSAVPPLLPPPFPFPPPGMSLDPSRPLPSAAELADMMQRAGIPLPPPGALPPGMIPPPPGFVPGLGGVPGLDVVASSSAGLGSLSGGAGAESVRRRGPLPSQEESLKMEQSRGNYTRAR